MHTGKSNRALPVVVAGIFCLGLAATSARAQSTSCDFTGLPASAKVELDCAVLTYPKKTRPATGEAIPVPPGGSLRATLKGKSAKATVREPGSATLKVTYLGRVDQKKARVNVRVFGLKLEPGPGLESSTLKALQAEAEQLRATLRGWSSSLTEEQKKQLARNGVLTLRFEEPFERLKLFAKPEALLTVVPPLPTGGANLEPYARALERITLQFFQLQSQQASIQGQLKQALQEYERLERLGRVLDLDTLAADLRAILNAKRKQQTGQQRLQRAQARVVALEAEFQKKQETVRRESALYVKGKYPYRELPDPQVYTRGAKPIGEAIRELEQAIQQSEKTLRENYRANNVDPKEVERLVEQRLRKRRARLRKLQELQQSRLHAAEEKAGLKEAETALQKARADQRAVEREIRAGGGIPANWPQVFAQYSGARRLLTEMRANPPRLPDRLQDTSPEQLQNALRAVESAKKTFESRKAKEEGKLARLAEQLSLNDRSLARLGYRLFRFRATAATRVSIALKELDKSSGEKNYGRLLGELDAFNSQLGEVNKLFSGADSRLEALQQFTRYMTEDRGAGKIVEQVRERVQLFSNTLTKIKKVTDHVALFDQFQAQLANNDPRFLSTVLRGVGPWAEKIPVIGQTVGQFITFYGKAADAILTQSRRIQDRIVNDALQALASGRESPEVRLYTREQVRGVMVHAGYDENKIDRITTAFQARRIIHLLGVRNRSELNRYRR